MSTAPPFLTEEQYLRLDEEAIDEKYEYCDGVIYALAGGTSTHSRIIANCIITFGNAVRGTACRVFDSNLRIRVDAVRDPIRRRTAYYTYADASIVCGPVQHMPKRRDTIVNRRSSSKLRLLPPNIETARSSWISTAGSPL